MPCEETINLQPDAGETTLNLQSDGEAVLNLQSSNIVIGGGGVTVYDASWLFEENPCTEEHLAELIDAIETNTPIIIRQGSESDYQLFSMTVMLYSENEVGVAATLSMTEEIEGEPSLAIAAPTFIVDRSTREVSLSVGSFSQADVDAAIASKADYGFYGIIDGTSTNPTDGAALTAGVYKADESKATSYINLPMEDGTTKRQSVQRGGIVIRTAARLIIFATQNLMYQYDTSNRYFYEPESFIESTLRRESEDGYAYLNLITPPSNYLITDPIVYLEGELNNSDIQHSRIVFTVSDEITDSNQFELLLTHSSGEDIVWQNGEVPVPKAGETWILEAFGRYVEAIRFTGTAATLSYNALADKPVITYTGTTIESRVVTHTPTNTTIEGTKPIGNYGPFNYIPLDMSGYTTSGANRALLPEDHLPDGAYVVTASGWMRLGTQTKQLQPGHIMFWDSTSGELDIIGYNACEYWGYDAQNDEWSGGYFTTQDDVQYMIDEAIGSGWSSTTSGQFIVESKENGYYMFNYSSTTGTTRRLRINVQGTNEFYYPYNGTILVKSDVGVMMLGRYNLWFAYNGTNYDQPIDLTTIQSQLDALDARITALGG